MNSVDSSDEIASLHRRPKFVESSRPFAVRWRPEVHTHSAVVHRSTLKPIGAVFARGARAWRRSAAGRWWRYDCTLIVYRIDRPEDTAGLALVDDVVGRNRRDHLERFPKDAQHLDRAAFLSTCERRIVAGERIYTVCPGEVLLAYAWMVPNQSRSWLTAVRRELRYPERSCVMYNAYTFPEARRRGYNTLLVRARIADAFLRFGAASVFTSVGAGNECAARAKLASGFRPWKELGLSTRRGRSIRIERDLCADGAAHEGCVSDAGAAIRLGIAATAAPSPRGI
jgi:hypothetical protein